MKNFKALQRRTSKTSEIQSTGRCQNTKVSWKELKYGRRAATKAARSATPEKRRGTQAPPTNADTAGGNLDGQAAARRPLPGREGRLNCYDAESMIPLKYVYKTTLKVSIMEAYGRSIMEL